MQGAWREYIPAMTPLGRAALGLGIVMVDIRFEDFDLVLDPVGWVIVLAGFAPLNGRSSWFQAASLAAGIGLVVSLVDLVGDLGALLSLVDLGAATALVFATCTALMEVLEWEPYRRTANLIRWLDLGLAALGALLVAGGAAAGRGEVRVSGAAAPPFVVFVLVALGVFVWFLVFLVRLRRDPRLQPTGRVPA